MYKIITNISMIEAQYNTFIFDIWGVLHNGSKIFNAANNCLLKLSHLKKNIILLSNSPMSANIVNAQLFKLGFFPEIKFSTFTSGEYAASIINNLNHLFYLIGPKSHDSFRELLSVKITHDIKSAGAIICTGFDKRIGDLKQHKAILEKVVDKGIKLYCVNPDKYAIINGNKIQCAGLIAQYYNKIGGQVVFFGKPYVDIYKHIKKMISFNKNKSIAIGDSLVADIKGANQFQLTSLLVLDGIHADEINRTSHTLKDNREQIECLSSRYKVTPNYVMQSIQW